jgi:hypothetical protein
MKRAHGLLGVSLATGLLLSACKQGAGDRCQVNSDCESGLMCVLGNNSSLTGGTCQKTGGGGGGVDAGVDAAKNDAGANNTGDAGAPDLSGTDSGPPDSSPTPDAGEDIGADLEANDLTPVG